MLPPYVRPGEPPTADWANAVVNSLRAIRNFVPQGSRKPTRTPSPPCPFGKLVSVEGERCIAGGLVLCGDKNFNVAPYEFEPEGEYVVWIEIPCEVNRDDNETLLLPGVKTSPLSSVTEWETGETYPDNTAPEVSDGLGTIILPIGSMADGVFTPTGCGGFTISHCGGTLSYSRS